MSEPALNRANTKSALSQCFQYLLTQETYRPVSLFINFYHRIQHLKHILYCMKSLSHFRIRFIHFSFTVLLYTRRLKRCLTRVLLCTAVSMKI